MTIIGNHKSRTQQVKMATYWHNKHLQLQGQHIAKNRYLSDHISPKLK